MKIFSELWRNNRLSILSGLLTGFAFAPFQYGYLLALFMLAPFLLDITDAGSYREALVKGYWFGFFSAISALYWIAFNTVAGFLFLLLAHPWSYMLFSLFFYVNWKNFQKKAFFPGVTLWVVLEAARSWGQLRFPWINLYYSMSYELGKIQIIEFTGPLILSLFLISVNFVICCIWREYREKKVLTPFWLRVSAVFLLLWLLSGLWGKNRILELEKRTYPLIKAGIVQPDIDAYEKSRAFAKNLAMQRLFRFTDSLAAAGGIELAVWPETAVFSYIRANGGMRLRVQNFSARRALPIFTGTLDYIRIGNKYHSFNAAWLVHPDSSAMDFYYKQYLVPGGETIPFKNYFPFLEKLDVGGGNFWNGKSDKTLNFSKTLGKGSFNGERWITDTSSANLEKVRIIPAICYESIYPELIRGQKVKNGGNLIAVITNDGWYGNTAGPWQHYRASVFRAVENRTSLVRAANNGISAFIDITGRVFEETELFTVDARSEILPLSDAVTVYDRYGLIWLWLLAGISLIWIAGLMIFAKTADTES